MTAALALAVGAWSVAVVAHYLEYWDPPATSLTSPLLRLGVPAATVAALVLYRGTVAPALRLAAGWVVLLSVALIVGGRLETTPTIALGIPIVTIAAVAAARKPAAIVVPLIVVSGGYGTMRAYTDVPIAQVIDVGVAALWAAVAGVLVLGRRRVPVHVTLGLGAMLVYLAVTGVHSLLVGEEAVTSAAVRLGPWFATLAVVIAISGWAPATRGRVAAGIAVVAALVGGYALLRWITGPTAAESELLEAARLSQFNEVGGETKVSGSLGSGQALGIWTSLAVPFCVGCVLGLRGPWRIVAGLGAALCLGALAASQLRIGLIAVGVSVPVVLLLYQAGRAFPGLRIGVVVATLAVVVLGGAGALTQVASENPESRQRLESLLDPAEDPSVEARRYKWRNAIDDITAKPFGHGLGSATSPFVDQARFATVARQNLDNAYLQIAYEQGTPIAALYALMLLALGLTLGRTAVHTRDRVSAGLAIGGAGTLASLAVLLLAGNYTTLYPVLLAWAAIGLGLAARTSR